VASFERTTSGIVEGEPPLGSLESDTNDMNAAPPQSPARVDQLPSTEASHSKDRLNMLADSVDGIAPPLKG